MKPDTNTEVSDSMNVVFPHITHCIFKDVPNSMYFSPICGPTEANTLLSHLICMCFISKDNFALLDTEAREMLLVTFSEGITGTRAMAVLGGPLLHEPELGPSGLARSQHEGMHLDHSAESGAGTSPGL